MSAQPANEYLSLTTMEDPACGLHRIAMLEIAGALRLLDEPGEDPAAATHECRKGIKRLRALARLARRRDPGGVRKTDSLLRRAGRALSGQRDADVVVDTARDLEPSHVTRGLAAALGAAVLTPGGSDAAEAAEVLATARERFEQMFDPDVEWRSDELLDAIVDEFETLQRRARVYLETRAEADAHETRKSVQRCLAELRVVASITHADVDARIDVLNEIAQKLGKHHDLAVLRTTLESVPKSTLSKADRKKLRQAAKARQRQIDAEIEVVLATVAASDPVELRAALTGEPAHYTGDPPALGEVFGGN